MTLDEPTSAASLASSVEASRRTGASVVPSSFSALPGWRDDNHAAAFAAFRVSCPAVIARIAAADASAAAPCTIETRLAEICRRALAGGLRRPSPAQARVFFEHHFAPHVFAQATGEALLTGYYEPVLEGSRERTARFHVPLHRRPADLVNIVAESERARADVALTHMRDTGSGLVPFHTRAEIDAGALAGQGLELVWLADPVDAFLAQVQGSVRVRLTDGTLLGLTYDGKNGHPYASVGRHLIARGAIAAADMSMQTMAAWLRADAARGREAMQQNASYVFFRPIIGAGSAASALGVLGTPLVAGRSLAVDTAWHPLGLPVFVDAPRLRHRGLPPRHGFRRLMIAQDTGSAIRGPERGDVYFGSGAAAGERAGITRHPCRFHVLLPRPRSGARGRRAG